MKTLVLRIYLTLVAVLLCFAVVGAWLVTRHFEQERSMFQKVIAERAAGWAELALAALPAADASPADLATAIDDLSRRLRLPLALDDASGRRLATASSFAQHEREVGEDLAADGVSSRTRERWKERSTVRLALPDGRTLVILRGTPRRPLLPPLPYGDATASLDSGLRESMRGGGRGMGLGTGPDWWRGPPFGPAGGLLLLLAVLFVAVAAAAWPVARRLTRRLETLQRGVEAFGAGRLQQRVAVEGRDEISSLATSFNRAAERVEALVTSNRSLLANASHEIRSPLARLKVAVSMLQDLQDRAPAVGGPLGARPASPVTSAVAPSVRSVPDRTDGLLAEPVDSYRDRLNTEVHANISELDGLIDELLLASRLEALPADDRSGMVDVDLWSLVDDEAHRARAEEDLADKEARSVTSWLDGPAAWPVDRIRPYAQGDERLLRRAVRNLLQNAKRYGGRQAVVAILRDDATAQAAWAISVTDSGLGVPADLRERIFEPFYRLPGHAEQQGGVGLGLSLVRQIAKRHGGAARCESNPAGGSVFTLSVPVAIA